MSTRLTTHTRSRLCAAILEDTFSARVASLFEREKRIAFLLRDHVAGKHLDAVLKLPDELVNMEGAVSVSVENEHRYTNLHFEPKLHSWSHAVWGHAGSAELNINSGRKFPSTGRVVLLAADSWRGQEVTDYLLARKTLACEIFECERLTDRTLASFSSIKKLLEHWPDVARLMPQNEVMQLPAVPVQDLIDRLTAAKEAA